MRQVLGKVVYIISDACLPQLTLIHRGEFSIMERGGGWEGYMGGMGVSRKGSDPPITSATNKGAGRPDGN